MSVRQALAVGDNTAWNRRPRNRTGWVHDGFVACARAVTATELWLIGLVLLVLYCFALASLVSGLGLVLVPLVSDGVRALTNFHRRLASNWYGLEIPSPHPPRPPHPVTPAGWWRRCRAVLSDAATWRDLLWMVRNLLFGPALVSTPVALAGHGFVGVVIVPAMVLFGGHGFPFLLGHLLPAFTRPGFELWLAPLQGAVLIPIGLLLAPPLLRVYFRSARGLLSPTANAQLALRVQHLARTRTQAVDAQAAELRRIERDLHDGAQAKLVALGMNLGLAEALLTSDPDAAARLLAEARESSAEALSEIRDLIRGIHPPVLAERGLDGALRALALRVPTHVEVDIDLPGRPRAPVESALYFAGAEALTNVAKHSEASRAWLRLRHHDSLLELVVGDDGGGGAVPGNGSGLCGIERRLAAFDGTLVVNSPVGGPTTIIMELPCVLSSPKTSPSSGTA